MEITNEETKKCNDELERSNLKPTIRIVNSFAPIIQISIKTQEGKKKIIVEAGMIDITLEYLKGVWDKQDGKCFYSGIQMQTKPNSDWKCSVERLDPDKGYIKGNVILACHELNCRTQWSIEKIKKL